jgi:hypothetical protein
MYQLLYYTFLPTSDKFELKKRREIATEPIEEVFISCQVSFFILMLDINFFFCCFRRDLSRCQFGFKLVETERKKSEMMRVETAKNNEIHLESWDTQTNKKKLRMNFQKFQLHTKKNYWEARSRNFNFNVAFLLSVNSHSKTQKNQIFHSPKKTWNNCETCFNFNIHQPTLKTLEHKNGWNK